MPRQNRVTPRGEIIRTEARGTLMGNRGGCLHDDAGELGIARWRSRQWIACLLEFKGRHREVMSPGRYTELFFLDEATALAAGHRPCMECRRDAFQHFRAAWLRGNGSRGHGPRISAPDLDRELHGDRVAHTRKQITVPAPIEELPNGAFIALPNAPGEAFLIWRGELLCWSPAGYREHRRGPQRGRVELLTPLSTVRAIEAGYVPAVHRSVELVGG